MSGDYFFNGDVTDLLGKELECRLTGLRGTCVGVTQYLYGCTRLSVQPPLKDGEMPEWVTLDLPQVREVVDSPSHPRGSNETGGPRPSPSRPNDIRR